MRSLGIALLLTALSTFGCRSRGGDTAKPSVEAAAPEKAAVEASPSTPAAIGAPAPDFTLTDLDGKSVKLSDFRGKTVVLEWFNPECPFVRASHTKGSLVGTAERHAKNGVVWLAINSGAPGKQGAGRENSIAGRERYGMKHPVLLDESGAVGKLYGAKTTPHMFVVSKDGLLVYAGAIDNSPDGEGDSPKDGKLVNYVDEALAALDAGTPVPNPTTEPYGCSVKYVN